MSFPASLVERHRARILAAVPDARVSVSGSALIPDPPADDLDLVALVVDVEDAAARLRSVYPPLHEDEWRDDWAAFREPGPPQVDVVVTCEGTPADVRHRLAWAILASDERLVAEYRELKADARDYAQRKAAFFERVARRVEGERA